MIKKNPETYSEIKAVNNILRISNYYKVSQSFIDDAYDFIMLDPNNKIDCLNTSIYFVDAKGNKVKSYSVDKSYEVAAMEVSQNKIKITPAYTYHNYGSSGGGYSSYSGGSSNNNNNNNNNNNH